MSFDNEETIFNVVVNDEEQYSIWPDYKEIPAGWHCVDQQGTKNECLAFIKEKWTDMRPLSLRQALQNEAP